MKSTIAIQSSFIAGDSRRLIERTDQGKKLTYPLRHTLSFRRNYTLATGTLSRDFELNSVWTRS